MSRVEGVGIVESVVVLRVLRSVENVVVLC